MARRGNGHTDDTVESGPPADVDLIGGTQPSYGDSSSELGLYRRGATIGRYMVLEQLGEGGMGVVYMAYDPELDRRVAIKLLGAQMSSSARKRLEREARALAKLSHPNVVQVYDASVYMGQVFLTMELVEGLTLQAWCLGESRPKWREVLEHYLDAARGLAAAHEKGLIHCDIKPTNLLIGQDGRVRVADFGLAAMFHHDVEGANGQDSRDSRGDDDSQASDSDSEESLRSLSSGRSNLQARLDQHCTRAGPLPGTLPYMAPEQHLAEVLGPAADQYSFCVSLYQGLHGTLPFAAPRRQRKSAHWLIQKRRAELVVPANTEVPAWLRKVLIRGLAAEPRDRYPSINALIAALESDPDRRRKVIVRKAAFAGVSVIAAAALAVLGWTHFGDEPGQACQGLERELHQVWNRASKAQIRTAFGATGLPYAADTFQRVSDNLDRYHDSWLAMRKETCRATFADKIQPPRVMHLRVACLDRRRDQLGALTDLFAAKDAATAIATVERKLVNKAFSATQALLPIDDCADIAALEAAAPLPEDLDIRSRMATLQPRVDRLELFYETGKFRDGIAHGQALWLEVSDLDHAPFRAQVMFWMGRLKAGAGDYSGAEAAFRATIPLAARAKDDVLVARTWSALVRTIAWLQARPQDAVVLLEALKAAAERADNDRVRARALHSTAGLFHRMAAYQEARAAFEESLASHERALGQDHLAVAAPLGDLAALFEDTADYEQALAKYLRALAIAEKALGPRHPVLVPGLLGAGRVLMQIRRPSAAEEYLRRAISIFGDAHGPDHPDLAEPLYTLGELLLAQRKPSASARVLRRALNLAARRHRAKIQLVLAEALWTEGSERQRAKQLAGEARDYYEQVDHQPMLERASRWLAEHKLPR